MPRIESYAYSDGTAKFRAVNSLVVEEQPTSPATTTARLEAPYVFTDALERWRVLLDASTPNGLYAIAYDTATRRVTIATTNAVNFRPVWSGADAELARWLGFDPAAVYAFATMHTGTEIPHGRADVLGVEVEPPEDAAQVAVQEVRLGRAVASVFGNHLLQSCTIIVSSTQSPSSWSWLTTGRVRVYPTVDTAPYAADNLDGYYDGYVVDQPQWQHENDETLRMLTIILAMSRG